MYSCGASPTKMGEEVRIIQNMIDKIEKWGILKARFPENNF